MPTMIWEPLGISEWLSLKRFALASQMSYGHLHGLPNQGKYPVWVNLQDLHSDDQPSYLAARVIGEKKLPGGHQILIADQ
jgi:hypothetical protein